MSDKILQFSDIALILDSCKNILQMTTVIIEQQKHMIELQQRTLEKQEYINQRQNEASEKLIRLLGKIENYTSKVVDIYSETKSNYSEIRDYIQGKMDDFSSDQEQQRLENVTWFGKLSNKIYIGMIASASIVASLIAVLIIVYEKYKILDDIVAMLQKIVIHFGL